MDIESQSLPHGFHTESVGNGGIKEISQIHKGGHCHSVVIETEQGVSPSHDPRPIRDPDERIPLATGKNATLRVDPRPQFPHDPRERTIAYQ